MSYVGRANRWCVLSFAMTMVIAASGLGATEEVVREYRPTEQLSEKAGLEDQLSLKTNFDGNGYADVAVGAPSVDDGGLDAVGALSVYYWNSGTSMPSSADYWVQSDMSASNSEAGDRLASVHREIELVENRPILTVTVSSTWRSERRTRVGTA